MEYVTVYEDWACVNIPWDDILIVAKKDLDIIVREIKSIICDNGSNTIEIYMNKSVKGGKFLYLLMLMDIPMGILVKYDTRSDIDTLYIIKRDF